MGLAGAAARRFDPFGILQGGYLAVFVDELLSTAIASVLEEGEWALTAEVKISYLRALNPGPVTGSARAATKSHVGLSRSAGRIG